MLERASRDGTRLTSRIAKHLPLLVVGNNQDSLTVRCTGATSYSSNSSWVQSRCGGEGPSWSDRNIELPMQILADDLSYHTPIIHQTERAPLGEQIELRSITIYHQIINLADNKKVDLIERVAV